MRGFKIDTGFVGKRLSLTSTWKPEYKDVINGKKIVEISLCESDGWRTENLSFLRDLPHLKALFIAEFNLQDLSPINDLHELIVLKLNTYCKVNLDFANFPKLEDCHLTTHPLNPSVYKCKSLKSFYQDGFQGRSFELLEGLTFLEDLTVRGLRVESLIGLDKLINLKQLRLIQMRKLVDIGSLSGLTNLLSLWMQSCRGLDDLSPLQWLSNLEELDLDDVGKINTLAPIRGLSKLRRLYCPASTNFVDGNLSVLDELPSLEMVAFQNRRHYNRKSEHFDKV